MNLARNRTGIGILAIGSLVLTAAPVWAGGHTWRVSEVFSSPCGTIQFVECVECCGGTMEVATGGHNVTSTTHLFTIPVNVVPPTSFKHLLFATPAFAALPGAPAPDYIFSPGSVPFFSTSGDTVSYVPYDTIMFTAAQLPTDGVRSLNHNLSPSSLFIAPNSPTNYAGATASVDASCAVAGDANGDNAANGLDIPAFIRAKLGVPEPGDSPACSEYCTGSIAGDVAAFVADLLS